MKPVKRRPRPEIAARAAMGEVELRGWYSKIPEPETTWPECSSCGTRARILDEEHKECIRCRIARARKARTEERHIETAGGESEPF